MKIKLNDVDLCDLIILILIFSFDEYAQIFTFIVVFMKEFL